MPRMPRLPRLRLAIFLFTIYRFGTQQASTLELAQLLIGAPGSKETARIALKQSANCAELAVDAVRERVTALLEMAKD